MSKPREFWIEEWNDGKWKSSTCWQIKLPAVQLIHAIEYSAFESLRTELEAAKSGRDIWKSSCESQIAEVKKLNDLISYVVPIRDELQAENENLKTAMIYANSKLGPVADAYDRLTKANEILKAGLEACRSAINNADYRVTQNNTGEKKYWVNQVAIEAIVDETYEKISGASEKAKNEARRVP